MRQVNLLPESLHKAQTVALIRDVLISILVPGLLIMVVIHVLLTLRIRELERLAERPPELFGTAETQQLQETIQRFKIQFNEYFTQNKALVAASTQQLSSPVLLKILGELSLQKVWFERLALDYHNGLCEISGRSFNTRLVSEFMLELKKFPFWENVELISMGKGSEGKIDFKILCHVKR